MNSDVKIMLKIYRTKKVDWMGFAVTKNCPLTRHHIFKRVYGGENNISNYALLIQKSHELLHKLEKIDHNAYLELNELFLELNRSMQPPDKEYYKNVGRVLTVSYTHLTLPTNREV